MTSSPLPYKLGNFLAFRVDNKPLTYYFSKNGVDFSVDKEGCIYLNNSKSISVAEAIWRSFTGTTLGHFTQFKSEMEFR